MPDTATIDALYRDKLLGPVNEHVGQLCRWVECDGRILRWEARRDQTSRC